MSSTNPEKGTDWMRWIPNVGFPIAVAVFLLVRMETVLGALTAEISDLRTETRMVRQILEDTYRRDYGVRYVPKELDDERRR